MLALIVILKQLFGHDAQLEGWPSDYNGAYRQVPIGPQQHKYAGIAWVDPHLLRVMVGMLTALAFGARRGPAH